MRRGSRTETTQPTGVDGRARDVGQREAPCWAASDRHADHLHLVVVVLHQAGPGCRGGSGWQDAVVSRRDERVHRATPARRLRLRRLKLLRRRSLGRRLAIAPHGAALRHGGGRWRGCTVMPLSSGGEGGEVGGGGRAAAASWQQQERRRRRRGDRPGWAAAAAAPPSSRSRTRTAVPSPHLPRLLLRSCDRADGSPALRST